MQQICDKVCQWLATVWWFSLGNSVSCTIKTDHHDITEILLKVALNTINHIYWVYQLSIFKSDTKHGCIKIIFDNHTIQPRCHHFWKYKCLQIQQFKWQKKDMPVKDILSLKEYKIVIQSCSLPWKITFLISVYNEESAHLYVHHDIMLSSFPLVVEWMNFDVGEDKPGKFIMISCYLHFNWLLNGWTLMLGKINQVS
jgi:hypothetical protein